MKLEFQNRWVRLLIEFFPPLPAIRRYRVVPPQLDGPTRRTLRQRVTWHLQRNGREVAP